MWAGKNVRLCFFLSGTPASQPRGAELFKDPNGKAMALKQPKLIIHCKGTETTHKKTQNQPKKSVLYQLPRPILQKSVVRKYDPVRPDSVGMGLVVPNDVLLANRLTIFRHCISMNF
jgi:hypothetical protein